MRELKSVPFSHEGISYEVRVSIRNDVVVIRAYRDDKPANGYLYEIELDREYDISNLTGISAVTSLVQSAIDDVKLDSWATLHRELGGT